MRFFSPSTLGVYDSRFHAAMPADAVQITEDAYSSILAAEREGQVTQAGPDGRPVSIPRPETGVPELLASAKSYLRTLRAPMLDALSGIAGRASRGGNADLAAEADALAESLLTVTADPALNEATTYEAMEAAGKAFYARLAAQASAPLKAVFREIAGA